MRRMMTCMLLVGCAVEPTYSEPYLRQQLPIETQVAVDALSSAILNRDVKMLAEVMAPTFLEEFGSPSAERDVKLMTFIEQQEEGFLMAYGRISPRVHDVTKNQGGELTVGFGDVAADPLVRLKKVNFWQSADGKVYFSGLRPTGSVVSGVTKQQLLAQTVGFDVANNASTTHYFRLSYLTNTYGQTNCTLCNGAFVPPAGSACPAVTPATSNTSGAISGGQAFGFTHLANCQGPGSCALRQLSPSNTGCTCNGSGGSNMTCLGGSTSCCFQNSFSSDFWWNSGNSDYASIPSCHVGNCPN